MGLSCIAPNIHHLNLWDRKRERSQFESECPCLAQAMDQPELRANISTSN